MNDKLRPLDELLAAAQEAEELERQLVAKRKQIGQTFASFRSHAGFTQASLGEHLGNKKQGYISQIEHGHRTPSSSTIKSFVDLAKETYSKGDTSGKEEESNE